MNGCPSSSSRQSQQRSCSAPPDRPASWCFRSPRQRRERRPLYWRRRPPESATAKKRRDRSARLIACKVISRKKNRVEDGMIDVYARVNHRYYTRATNTITVLSILKPDDLGRGLRGIAV